MKKTKLWTGVLPLLCLTLCSCSTADSVAKTDVPDYKYWDLGIGSYGSKYGGWHDTTLLDIARYDWVYICYGNEPATKANTERLNEYLKINPKQKYVLRLWPSFQYQAPGQTKKHKCTFLDYLYQPDVKKRFLKSIDQQIDSVMDHISDKNALYGITLMEEMPCHFSDNAHYKVAPAPIPWDIAYYKKNYEQETGKKLTKWDESAKKWWGKKLVQAFNEIHAHIRKRVPGKRIFVYFMAHVRTMDFLEKGENVMTWGVMPFYMKDLIGPDKADGLFAFPGNKRYMLKWAELAKQLKIPYFSQFSVRGDMRMLPWDDYNALAKAKHKENLGYFYYASNYDWRGKWNDPPYGLNDPWRATIQIRQHLAHENVNMDIVRKNLKPEILLDYDFENTPMNSWAVIHMVIRNPADDTWFVNPGEGTMKNICLKPTVPPEFELPELNNPDEFCIKQLDGGKSVECILWARRSAPDNKQKKMEPLKINVTADGFEPFTIVSTERKKQITNKPFYTLRNSGDTMQYINFKLPYDAITDSEITLQCSNKACSMPSIAISAGGRLTWNGMLERGDSLKFGPGRKATLFRKGDKVGEDVTKDVYGTPLKLTKGINLITYYDQDAMTGPVKAKLFVKPVMKQNKK